jgi:N-acetylglucosamine-6-phosphate deacetylase
VILADAARWFELEGERLVATGRGRAPRPPDERCDGRLARGLVDLQVNGCAGADVTGGHAALDRLDAHLLARGVTSYLATVATTDDETAARAAADVVEREADPASPVAGLHLEGPFLARPGAHPAALLRAPADGPLPGAYGSPALRLVTLAPELPGALELIAALRERGVTVALGHSDADATTALRAVEAGARMVTHVFNAMAPLHHRAPGLVGVALTDERLAVGVIADGEHVEALVLRLVRRAAGERVVLVSDLVGETLAGRAPASGVLTGGRATLDEALRRWMHFTGAPLDEALEAAAVRPAALAGVGARADLVELDEASRVVRVMRGGRWLA